MDLSRVAYVIGQENIEKLQAAHVAVVGLGGVGSYIAEALARSGVGALTLVDADEVAPSNINRQRMRQVSRGNSRHSLVGGATSRKTPISRSALDKNVMP